MLMLELDDAVKVASEVIEDYFDDKWHPEERDYLRQELMQKCYFVKRDDSPEKDLADLIDDVNVVEIGDQIAHGKLSQWCISWRVAATTQLARSMWKWQTGDPAPGIYEVTFTIEPSPERYLNYAYWNGERWYSYKTDGYIEDKAPGAKVLAWRERSEPYQG